MSKKTTPWQPIETAPRGPFVLDFTTTVGDKPTRFRNGPKIVLRGCHEDG